MSSTTPRVDSVMRAAGNMMANAVVVDAPMARMLEIELRDASQELERLRTDVLLLRNALIGLEDATSNIPGDYGPDVWRVIESARQALEKTKP